MTSNNLPPSTKTFDESPLPNFEVRIESDASQELADLIKRINPKDIMQKAVLATYKWLFTPETPPTSFKSFILFVTGQAREIDKAQYREAHIYVSNADMESVLVPDGGTDGVETSIAGLIIRLVTRSLLMRHSKHQNYLKFEKTFAGLANYLMLKEAGKELPSYFQPTKEVWYDDWMAMPHFLHYVGKKYEDSIIRRLIEAFELEDHLDELVLEEVTGIPFSRFWKAYCAIPITRLVLHGVDLQRDDLKVIFETKQPLVAVHKARTVFLKHFYTPETIPTKIKEISLILRSGLSENCCTVNPTDESYSRWEICLSWDHMKSTSESATDNFMMQLMKSVAVCYTPVKVEDLELIKGIGVFTLLQEKGGPVPRPEQFAEGSWDSSKIANIFAWLESTFEEGSILKVYKGLIQDHYDPSCFTVLSGKPIHDLLGEDAASISAVPVPETEPAVGSKGTMTLNRQFWTPFITL